MTRMNTPPLSRFLRGRFHVAFLRIFMLLVVLASVDIWVKPLGFSALFAGARLTGTRLSRERVLPPIQMSENEKLQASWRDFSQLMKEYKKLEPAIGLALMENYLQKWPTSPWADSVKLLAVQSCMQLSKLNLAYDFCSSLGHEDLQHRVLDIRLQLLYEMGRFVDVRRLFLEDSMQDMDPRVRARCEFFMAQALYRSMQLDPTVLGESVDFPLLEPKQIQGIEQALAYYRSSESNLGAQAYIGAGECAHWLGMSSQAAKSYMEAAQMPGVDSARMFYLSSLALRETDPSQALDFAEKAYEIESGWKEKSAILWVQLALQHKQYAALIELTPLVKTAMSYRLYETLWSQSLACQAMQKPLQQQEYLQILLEKAFVDPDAYKITRVHQALQALGTLFLQQDQPQVLQEWLQRYGRSCGRDDAYFSTMFWLAQAWEGKHNEEEALKSYSAIVVQRPMFNQIDECLLHKGLLEASLNKPVQAWSTLDLYLREHASRREANFEKGLAQAWPVYLRTSVDLYDYPPAKQLNLQRFDLVLDRLAQAPVTLAQKQTWIYEQALAMDKVEQWSQVENFLWTASARHGELISPASHLLMASCQVQLNHDINSYFEKAEGIFAGIQDTQLRAQVQVAFVDRLQALKSVCPDHAALLEIRSSRALDEIFHERVDVLDVSHLLQLYHFLQSKLDIASSCQPWDSYFPSMIYQPALQRFVIPTFSSSQQDALRQLMQLGSKIKERQGGLEDSLTLDMAHYAWLEGDLNLCAQWLPEKRMSQPSHESYRLSLLVALSQQAHDMTKYWDYATQLLTIMKQVPASNEVRLNFEMALAKQTAARAREVSDLSPIQRMGSTKSKLGATPAVINWRSRALELFQDIDDERQACTEPLHMESAIEKARLLAWSGQGDDRERLEKELIAVKLRYMESSEGLEKYREQMLSQDATRYSYHAYMALIDAMLAQDEADRDRQQGFEEEATLKENVARQLYSSLQKEHYLVTNYMGLRVQEGLKNLQDGVKKS